jgi:hypothetical protein
MIVKKAFVQATLLWVAGIIFTLAFSRWADDCSVVITVKVVCG